MSIDIIAHDARTFVYALQRALPYALDIRAIREDSPPIQLITRDTEAVLAFIGEHQERHNLYLGGCLRFANAREGKAANVKAATALWVDIDCGPDEQAKANALARIEGDLQSLSTGVMLPTFVVDSGNGLHAWYLLSEPIEFGYDDPQARLFEDVLHGMAKRLGGDTAVCDLARVMRVPGTWNLPSKAKREKGARVVQSKVWKVYDEELRGRPFQDYVHLAQQRLRAGSQANTGDLIPRLSPGIKRLVRYNGDVKRRWEGDVEGLGDPSPSGIDASLATSFALSAIRMDGVTESNEAFIKQEIAEALKERRGDEKRDEYYHLTARYGWDAAIKVITEGDEEEAKSDQVVRSAKGKREPALSLRLARQVMDEESVRVGAGGVLYFHEGGVWSSDVSGKALFTRLTQMQPVTARTAKNVYDDLVMQVEDIDPEQGSSRINCRNGLLDPLTGELHPHTPDDPSTCQVSVDWNPNASPGRMDAFLGEVFSDDAAKAWLTCVGLAVIQKRVAQKAVMLHGPGGNGKSVALSTVEALVGSHNVASVPLQALGENRFYAAELVGKLANVCGDLAPTLLKETSAFKQLVGGDTIHADRKYGHPFTFKTSATLFYSANELPPSVDHSEGFYDRWIVLGMDGRFRETAREERDLDVQLAEPAELEWLLTAAVAHLSTFMTTNVWPGIETIRAGVEEYRQHGDPLMTFARDYVHSTPDLTVFTSRADFYQAYVRYCEMEGRKPIGASKFTRRMRNEVLRRYEHTMEECIRKGVRGFKGVTYNPVG